MPIVKPDRAKALADIAKRDWSESDALTDADIARQVAENPDAAPLLAEGDDLSSWRKVRGRPRADRLCPPTTAKGKSYSFVMSRGSEVAALRHRLGMTQAEFAKTYGFSTAAVRSIEQGTRQPSGPMKALLTVIEKDPEFVRRALAGKAAH